jgi:hypothetical protein
VIAALEGKHQALAVARITHELQRILDGLAAADVELHPTLHAELARGVAGDGGGKLDLLAVQILARELGQAVELAAHDVGQAWVGVAEVDRRVPHLQVEVGAPTCVVQERAFAGLEDLRRLAVVDGIAVRAVQGLEGEQFVLVTQRTRFMQVVYASGTHRRIPPLLLWCGSTSPAAPRTLRCSPRIHVHRPSVDDLQQMMLCARGGQ